MAVYTRFGGLKNEYIFMLLLCVCGCCVGCGDTVEVMG